MCSTLTNNAHSSGKLTFVASLFTFVAAQLWGLRTATSTPYMLWSLRAEWHTCLSGFCICVYGSGQNSIVGLLHQQLHSTAYASPVPLGHYKAIGGQWGYCFRCTHIHMRIPLDPLSVVCAGCLLLVCSSRFRPFSSHCMSKHIYSQQLVSVNGRWEQKLLLKFVCNFSSTNTYCTCYSFLDMPFSSLPLLLFSQQMRFSVF